MKKIQFGATSNLDNFKKLNKLLSLSEIVREQYEMEYPSCSTLEGFCGLASYRLLKMANYNKLYPTMCYGLYDSICHAWIEYCGYIVDLTATQFGIWERIYVIEKPSKKYKKIDWSSRAGDGKHILHWCWDEVNDQFYKRARVKI